MYEINNVVQRLRSAAKRRKVILIITPLIFVAISITYVLTVEPVYKSSTTILVEKDETLNPLVMYEMAVNLASEDRLRSFNEIIYSNSTMELLIDSLRLDKEIDSENQRQGLIEKIRRDVGTSSRASDSFEISFYNREPEKARDGVSILANHFIMTRIRLENRRNSETVNFFSNKLNELEQVVFDQRNQQVNVNTDRLRDSPVDTDALQTRLQEVDSQLEVLEWQIFQEEDKLSIINSYKDQGNEVQLLYKLPLSEMAFGEELTVLLSEYSDLNQRFTESYPRLQSLRSQIEQVTLRIPGTLESNLARYRQQKNDLQRQRELIINDIQRSYVASQRANTQQSDFSIYEGLYNDMKIKLEQAKISQDIGNRAAEQFIVLDAPYIPESPVSPQKKLIIGAGLMLGLIFGVVFSATAEVLDRTIRIESDLPYNKPVIVYLTQGGYDE